MKLCAKNRWVLTGLPCLILIGSILAWNHWHNPVESTAETDRTTTETYVPTGLVSVDQQLLSRSTDPSKMVPLAPPGIPMHPGMNIDPTELAKQAQPNLRMLPMPGQGLNPMGMPSAPGNPLLQPMLPHHPTPSVGVSSIPLPLSPMPPVLLNSSTSSVEQGPWPSPTATK